MKQVELNTRPSYHYDGDRLISEEDMTGTVREYLYASNFSPAAMRARQPDGSYSNYFFVTNTHGDVVAVTDKDGNIVNRYAYGPWGEATRVSEQVHQPFRYAGYFYESTVDLYWLSSRWYDAGTGRFLSRDQFRGLRKVLPSLNKYAYTWGNSATLIDSSGYSPRRPQGTRPPGVYPECSSGSSSGSTWDLLMGVVGPPCDFKTHISPPYDPEYKDTEAGWRMIKPSWAGDACSLPALDTGPYWNFWDACGTHDYGYDLIRYGHRTSHVLVSKGDVDDLFFVDMSAHCERRGFFTKEQCRAVAAAYYFAVRNNGSEPT